MTNHQEQIKERLGQEIYNNQGYLMKIIKYNSATDIVIEFQDKYKARINAKYGDFKRGLIRNPNTNLEKIGKENLNNQGCLMKLIEYNKNDDVIVEFQDEYKAKVKTRYYRFLNGGVKNPYHPSAYNIGIIGEKYSSRDGDGKTKEYTTWMNVLQRCFDEKYKEKHLAYKNTACCDEWLLFENFYEWLHFQENFDKWFNGERWAIDKDILTKGNKIYSPNNCCLVPQNVNCLFTKNDIKRGDLPIGVCLNYKKFQAYCMNPFENKRIALGNYNTPEEAFKAYKSYKEDLIKQVAKIEYDKGNIIKSCYEAMMNYEVNIND